MQVSNHLHSHVWTSHWHPEGHSWTSKGNASTDIKGPSTSHRRTQKPVRNYIPRERLWSESHFRLVFFLSLRECIFFFPRNSLSTKNISLNQLFSSLLVKPVLSRNFCQNCVRENSYNFNSVLWKFWKFTATILAQKIPSNELFTKELYS